MVCVFMKGDHTTSIQIRLKVGQQLTGAADKQGLAETQQSGQEDP